MELKQIKKLIDCYVMYGSNKVIIRGWTKGWVEVEMADNAEITKKVRSKELLPIPGGYEDGNNSEAGSTEEIVAEKPQEAPAELNQEEFVEEAKAEKKIAKAPFDLTMQDVDCPSCGSVINIPEGRTENIRCKKCGAIFVVRLHPVKENYVTGLGATISGRDTTDIADEIADKLRGMGPDELYPFAEEMLEKIGMDCALGKNMKGKFNKSGQTISEFLKAKYGHLNNGMQRMNIGNLLRGANARCSKKKEGDI